MTSQLCLHVDVSKVTIDDITAVPTPEQTETWYPVPYRRFVDLSEDAMRNAGYGIARRHFGLSKDGKRMFATYDLESEILEGTGLAVGLRSSYDQTFAMGFCCGSRVFVCDNLAFSAEHRLSRKQTRFGQDRYAEWINTVVAGLEQFKAAEAAWMNRMDERPVDDREAAALILRSHEAGAVFGLMRPAVWKEWRTPTLPSQENRTAWGLFNCFTFAMRERQPELISRRTLALRGLFSAAI